MRTFLNYPEFLATAFNLRSNSIYHVEENLNKKYITYGRDSQVVFRHLGLFYGKNVRRLDGWCGGWDGWCGEVVGWMGWAGVGERWRGM